jgi:mitochondrial fission protein ELM1
MLVWGITDGTAGTVAQVKALAAALGYMPVMKTVHVKRPFVWLPNAAYNGALQKLLPQAISSHDTLAAPWPEIIISCGRRGALAALAIKKDVERVRCGDVEKNKSPHPHIPTSPRLIHIHDPQMNAKHFDVIIAMQHDKIEAPNVIKVKLALHAITPALLAEAKEKFSKRFSGYAKPYVAMLLGGSTNKYTLTKSRMSQVISSLQRLAGAAPGSLLITTSRRTGYENLQALLIAFPRMRDAKAYVYDGVGDNPYLGMLALAEHIVVTNDSVNMMSEAVATGKPVYILRLPGHTDTKPARFAEMLITEGFARALEGKLETWNYPLSDEMKKISETIKPLLAA